MTVSGLFIERVLQVLWFKNVVLVFLLLTSLEFNIFTNIYCTESALFSLCNTTFFLLFKDFDRQLFFDLLFFKEELISDCKIVLVLPKLIFCLVKSLLKIVLMLDGHFLGLFFLFCLSSGNILQLLYLLCEGMTVLFDWTSEIRVVDLFLMLKKRL